MPEIVRSVKAGDLSETKRLVGEGARIDATDSQGMTALMWAANHGNLELTKLLLDNHADPNAQDTFGWTALIQAAGAGHLEVVEVLLDSGASVSRRTRNGVTALIAASAYEPVAKLLLHHGADPSARTNDGTTALAAAQVSASEAVVELIERALSPTLSEKEAVPEEAHLGASQQPPAIPNEPILEDGLPAGEGLYASLENLGLPPSIIETLEGTAVALHQPDFTDLEPVPLPQLRLAEGNVLPREPNYHQLARKNPAASTETRDPEGVYLQVGAFRSPKNAENLKQRLEPREDLSVTIRESSRISLLVVGPFADRDAAASYRDQLKQEGFESFVTHLSAQKESTGSETDALHAEDSRPAEMDPLRTAAENTVHPPQPTAPKIAETRGSADGSFFVQAGAFRTEEKALAFAEQLGTAKLAPTVQYGGDAWFRVVVGPFPDRKAANAAKQRLLLDGIESLVRSP